MKFSIFFIDRPIFAIVFSVLTVIIGGLAALSLAIERHPEIAPPTVVVSTNYPGADAKTLAETVAAPLEQEINGVEDMLYMSSISSNDGSLSITITFKLGTDLDKAQILVQNRTILAESKLPEEVRRNGIRVRKSSPALTLVINLTSPNNTYDQSYIGNYAVLKIKDEISRLRGIGNLIVFGARDYSMRVWLDVDKLSARSLTAMDVVDAIREQNIEVAAGILGQQPSVENTPYQFVVQTSGRLTTVAEFNDIIIKAKANGSLIKLEDVARVELGAANYDSSLLFDTKPGIGLGIFQQPNTNALETKKAVMKKMQQLAKDFPDDLEYSVVYDTTLFVEESIKAVIKVLIEAILIVLLVVLVFLQNWRATLIPMLAIPTSVIGTLAVLAIFGYSLNTLSLIAMVLAIGIVVDDAIVVVENVSRGLAQGLNRREATIRAISEVTGPIITSATVLAAVFIPAAFTPGLSGQFYNQFALTIAASTILSAINSLTLSPALSANFLAEKQHKKDALQRVIDGSLGWLFNGFNHGFDWLREHYGNMVARLIRIILIMMILYAGLIGLGYYGLKSVPQTFIPSEDQGYLIALVQLPDAASLPRTDAVVRRAQKIILQNKAVSGTAGVVGWSVINRSQQSNLATIFIPLKPFDERNQPEFYAHNIAADINQRLSPIQEAFIGVFPPPTIRGIGSIGGFKMYIQDKSGYGVEALAEATQSLLAAGREDDRITRLFSSFRANQPQKYLQINKIQAQTSGVKMDDIYDTLKIFLGSLYVNDINLFGRTYSVIAQADAPYRMKPKDIGRLQTRNKNGDMVPLAGLVSVSEITGPDKITRYNLATAADINGSVTPNVSSTEMIGIMESLAKKTLPYGFDFAWTDLTYQQIETGNFGLLIFPLSILLVFLALAAQYESWSLPFIIMLIVPMCLLSAITGIWLDNSTNNIFTQIGFLILIGLAAKNAVLIVEFAKTLEEQGYTAVNAAVEAARLRLRPIMMTSLSLIFGIMPLVTSSGAGAESRHAIGITVTSGMVGVTLFGLIFTPLFYVMVRKVFPLR